MKYIFSLACLCSASSAFAEIHYCYAANDSQHEFLLSKYSTALRPNSRTYSPSAACWPRRAWPTTAHFAFRLTPPPI